MGPGGGPIGGMASTGMVSGGEATLVAGGGESNCIWCLLCFRIAVYM